MKRNFSILINLITFVLVFTSAAAPCCRAEGLSHPNSAEAARLDESSCDDGFSFVVMADSHQSTDVFPQLMHMAQALEPDFYISVGDVTNDGLEQEYAFFLDQIAQVDEPWFVVPGNHEYRSPQGHTSLEGRKRFKQIFGPGDFFFDHCGWRFISLDVVAFDMLRPEQLKKLEKALKGHEGRAAVFMHYPPAVIENWPEGYWKANGAEFLALLEKYEVPWFFSGHIHVFDRLRIGPTAYIITGGAGGGLDSERPTDMLYDPDGGAYYHFILAEIKDDIATETVVHPDIDPAPDKSSGGYTD